jgi:hypothetical protein
LTAQEIAMIDEGMAEYRKNPSSFIPLELTIERHDLTKRLIT